MSQIFPKEILDNTLEVHHFKNTVTSKIIYTVLLVSIVGFGLSTPFIEVDIYTSATGILKASKERNQLSSLHSGKIKAFFIEENLNVQKGDTLLIVDHNSLLDKINLISQKIIQTKVLIHDLEYLLKKGYPILDSLQSFQYQKEQIQFSQKHHELQTRYRKAKKDFLRQKKLFLKNIIARIVLENSKFKFDLAISELNHHRKQQVNQWQAELTSQKVNIQELKSRLRQQEIEESNYTIIAPIDGTIQNLVGLAIGNFIIAGQPFADISPESDLIGECYVPTSNIGLIDVGTPIKFQMDAFNYNQWGLATGKIKTINKDVALIDKVPMFKVVCVIDQKQLSLKSGVCGNFKKGMTFRAQFLLARRSAFNLLQDKVDNWFNPSKNNPS